MPFRTGSGASSSRASGQVRKQLSADTFMSARSRASARSICTRWSTRSAPTPSAFCTHQVARGRSRGAANDVVPLYVRLDLPTGAVLTDNGRGVLRHRESYQSRRALEDQHRLATHQWLRRALQRHRAGGGHPPPCAPGYRRFPTRGAPGRGLALQAPRPILVPARLCLISEIRRSAYGSAPTAPARSRRSGVRVPW